MNTIGVYSIIVQRAQLPGATGVGPAREEHKAMEEEVERMKSTLLSSE